MKIKKILALVLAACLVCACLASCGVVEFEGNFTYNDSVSTMASNWNPHTYQTSDDAYPADFLRVGFYSFIFNDEIHPVEGKEHYTGYRFLPEMAESEPVDVTEAIKAAYPKYGIPESATKGFAYTIDLNKDAVWENGEAIKAEDYVYSMRRLLDPDLLNYRAADYMESSFMIANGDKYFYQGTSSYKDNALLDEFIADMAELTKNANGQYETADGKLVCLGINFKLDWLSNNTLKQYVDAYGDQYFVLDTWDALVAQMDKNGLIPLTDENYELFVPVIAGNPEWGETAADIVNYFAVEDIRYEDNYSFDNVGIFASGEYQITIVLGRSLAGFNLLYNLTSNWLVNETLYESCLKQVGDAWSSTYNTSVETTLSYGPYKLTSFQTDKSMIFEKNDAWYGYKDGEHIYVDPTDGKTYPMYQTTKVNCQVVGEAATRKLMFLSGQLMGYGLQAEDFEAYRSSEYCYATPSETIYFFIFNGYLEQIQKRENNEGFDKTLFDIETITLLNFRKAIAVTYDKELLCATVSPARSGGYGLIGTNYIYDPDTGAKYRETDQAKQALCDFYSVDVSKFDSLDAAVDSITGFDPVAAKQLFTQAFNDSIAAGYITDANNDGKSDQTIRIEYASSAPSAFITKTLNYLNEKLAEVLVGTPFEGKIEFYESAPLGNNWSTNIRNGISDTVLGGWSGSALDPFGLSDLYANPSRSYDAKWFDATTTNITMSVNVAGIDAPPAVKELTMTLKEWSDALNGVVVVASDGTEYNFGDGQADVETRLTILSKIEATVLQTYNYIPMLQDGGMALLSKQVYYVIDEYSAIMGRGGLPYLKYNYTDEAWAAYVAEQGGTLAY